MNQFQKLHQELHSFRESIAGSADWDTPTMLRNRLDYLLKEYLEVNSDTALKLSKVRALLQQLREDDLALRIQIDSLVCDILNEQEKHFM